MESTGTGAARKALGVKGIFAAILGNGFEFYDFGVYAAYIGIIGQTFYPGDNALVSDLASAATFGVGFVARPVGAALIGAYADRVGRKPAMTLTIGLMALGSAMIAVLPGYASIGALAPILLVVARLFQGFAVGGEMGPATMFMLEGAPAGRRIFYGSWQLASQNLGSIGVGLTGFLLASLLSKSTMNEWGWRAPFALGILIAPVGLYIRSQLDETLAPSKDKAPNSSAILSTVLKDNGFGVLLGLALIAGGTITQYFLINMTPYAIRTLHLPDATAMLGSVSLGVTGAIGSLLGGFLADRFGIRVVAILPRLLLLALLWPIMKYLVAAPSASTLVVAVGVLSVLHGASASVGVMLIPLLFPTSARATGLALTYSLGVAIFGGTATYIVTWLVGATGDPLASVYYVFAANFVMLAAILAIRNVSYEASPRN